MPAFTRPTPFRLGSILLLTLLLWNGARNIEPNGDDYQYLHSLAPISNASDLVKPFYSSDCNTSVFRPISNMTMVFDFLVFGWWGGGFHLTNLFFHLLGTAIVFFFARSIFGLDENTSLIATLLFGILGGHDGNIVTSTERADILPAIFAMLALLAEKKTDTSSRRLAWKIVALLLYFAATLSKEIGIMIVPLVAVLFDFVPGSFNWAAVRRGFLRMLPYIFVTLVYYVYHAHFTSLDALHSQPLQSEGATSPVAFLRNWIYGIAYMLLPLDLKTATALLTDYKLPLLLGAAATLILTTVVTLRLLRRTEIIALYKPAIFVLVTMALVSLSFERWRLYTPSIGLVSIIAIVGSSLWARYPARIWRSAILCAAILFVGFHMSYAYSMVENAVQSTARLTEYKTELGQLIAPLYQTSMSQGDSLDVTLLDMPAKLGSISVLQIGLEAAVQQGIAETLHTPGAAIADVHAISINCNACVFIYALDPARGFRDVSMKRISAREYEFQTPIASSTRLLPDQNYVNGVAWRDRSLKSGDTIEEERAKLIIEEAKGATATKIDVRLNSVRTLPILFRNGRFEFAK